jgi:hypothetical protein
LPLKINNNGVHITNDIFPNGEGDFFGPNENIEPGIKILLPMLNYIAPSKTKIKEISFNINNYYDSKTITYNESTSCFFNLEDEDNSIKDEIKKIVNTLQGNEKWPNEIKKQPMTTAFSLTRLNNCGNESFFTIGYAVYLPLDANITKVKINAKYSYSLLLHGPFAVDSGRRGIKHFNSLPDEVIDYTANITTEDDLYRQWNQFIAQVCLHPYLLKILEKGEKEKIIDEDDIKEVFSVIKQEFKPVSNFILKKYNFARTFQDSWKLFDSHSQIYIIPQIDKGLFLEDIFKNDFDGIIVNFNSIDETNWSFLPENCFNNLNPVIKNLRDDIFSSRGKIEYLIKYMELIKEKL